MSGRNYSKNKSKAQSHVKLPVWLIVIIIIACVGYVIYKNYNNNEQPVSGELSIHVLQLGNSGSGDCIYIKAGQTDILVDAGSATDSLSTITSYVDGYCTDKIFEYAIVTHADADHIACFAGTGKINSSLFDLYEFKTIIDFPKTNKDTATYHRYVEKRDEEISHGATHYTALECCKNENGAKKEYVISENITLEILYNYFYEHYDNDENNYSVCFRIIHGGKEFLFTGDLEEQGEQELVKYNDLNQVEFFKAGHHGSKTSSNEVLLNKIRPKICAVSCVAGDKYKFPTQEFINRISKYTDKVYVTSYFDESSKASRADLNGNIVIVSSSGGTVVNCSNNNTLFKDSAWFNQNRKSVVWKVA